MHDDKECSWSYGYVLDGEWVVIGETCPQCTAFFAANLRQMCKSCGKPIDDHVKDGLGIILRC